MASIWSRYHSKTSATQPQAMPQHALCRTDHALVHCKLQITPKKFYQTRPKSSTLVDVSSTRDSLCNQHCQQLLSTKLDNATSPTDPNVAWCTTRDVIMSSALEAHDHWSKAQSDWFRNNANLLLPAVAATWSAKLKTTARNSHSAHRELQAAKCTVQCLTRFAVLRYWENLSTRIQQCADCGDLHGQNSKESVRFTHSWQSTLGWHLCPTGTLGGSI